jgi:hypothetical protein
MSQVLTYYSFELTFGGEGSRSWPSQPKFRIPFVPCLAHSTSTCFIGTKIFVEAPNKKLFALNSVSSRKIPGSAIYVSFFAWRVFLDTLIPGIFPGLLLAKHKLLGPYYNRSIELF